jgi:hypothetical protein
MSSSIDRATRIAKRRADIVQRFLTLRTQQSNQAAARALGYPFQTIYVWQRAFAAGGVAALRPKCSNSGRRSHVAGVQLTGAALMKIESLLLQMGVDRAWREFIKTPVCPPALAKSALRTMPAPIRKQVSLTPLPARCRAFRSADGQRLLVRVKLNGRAGR